MRILVLGGTQMLGRDFVEKNREKHSIVIANRGITKPNLFNDLEHVWIDRDISASVNDYGAVGCRALGHIGCVDAVVDFSCYSVEHLKNVVPFLPNYNRYVYVSTMSVFDQAALRQPDPANPYYWYCVNKIQCEDWISTYSEQERWSVVRPCAVYGDHDYTGRFVRKNGLFYWKASGRIASEGSISVEKVSKALESEIYLKGFRKINLC